MANFALRPYEDADANKRLELLIELADGVSMPEEKQIASLSEAIWGELALVNQDFRESIKMIPGERRPTLKLFAFGTSPISAQDIRIKKRYII